MFGHRLKVAVIMKEGMALFDAKRANDDIYGFAHRHSSRAQKAIISCSLDGKRIAQHRSDSELAEVPLDQGSMMLVAGALKNFDEN